MNLHEYQKSRELICIWYDKIVEHRQLLYLDEQRVDALREAKENLLQNRFRVAVCGQMNSGKSTLLNALLFADEVLPMNVTTMTAKITLMKGGEHESVVATLYTPQEFRTVELSSQANRHSRDELTAAREDARRADLAEGDLLKSPAIKKTEDGLDSLPKFVAVSGKGGLYSVYVKEVSLFADRPWLRQVTVVDTPGTNDPNPVRDRITRDWIDQADAVVFVTFAGQAGMTNEDVRFIDQYLAHIDRNHIVIAVNKCDEQADRAAILRHIHKVRDSGDERMRYLFEDDERIILVSGLGGLISEMRRAGRSVSEDMEWYVKKLAASGYLQPEQHGVDRLRDFVERQIIDNRGRGLVDSHGRRLGKIFEAAAARLSRNRGAMVQGLNAADASLDEIEAERKRLNSQRKEVSRVRDRQKNLLKTNVIQKAVRDIRRGINEVRKHVHNEVSMHLDGQALKNMESYTKFTITRELDTKRDVIAQPIDRASQDLSKRLEEAEDDFCKCLKGELGSYQRWYPLVDVRPQTLCRDMTKDLLERLSRDTRGIVHDMTGWLGRLLNLKRARGTAASELKNRAGESLRKGLAEFEEHVERELNSNVDGALREMEQHVTDVLQDIDKRIGEQQNRQSSGEETRKRIRDEMKVIDEKIDMVTKLQAEYDAARASIDRN